MVSVDAGGRRDHQDPAILTFTHDWPGGASNAKGAEHVYAVDGVPIVIAHLVETDVTNDASVVDNTVDASIVGHGQVNDALPLLMDAQFPDAKALKNDILVDVLIVPDIMIYYNSRIRKSVVVLINVQKLGMDDPLYFIVRVNQGRLQRGVLGNYIYNAIKQAE